MVRRRPAPSCYRRDSRLETRSDGGPCDYGMRHDGEILSSDFEELVMEALASLPEGIARRIDNVEIVVEDEPPDDVLRDLPPDEVVFGYYHGIPLTERGHYDGVLPDKISIYEGPITRTFRRPNVIREEVRRTVIHEVAHHFGIDDQRLDELGWS